MLLISLLYTLVFSVILTPYRQDESSDESSEESSSEEEKTAKKPATNGKVCASSLYRMISYCGSLGVITGKGRPCKEGEQRL